MRNRHRIRIGKFRYKVGDTVKSSYSARWIGVVVRVDDEIKGVYTVVPMVDRAGHPQRRKFTKRLCQAWLTPAKLHEDQIRKDWL